MEDDVYRSYHLPKGATIVFNTWSALAVCKSRWALTQCLLGLCRVIQTSIPNQMFSNPSDSSLRVVAYPIYMTQRSLYSASDVGEHCHQNCASPYIIHNRVCPGRYFADAMIWLAAASIAATMDILPAQNPQGEIIVPSSRFVSGAVM